MVPLEDFWIWLAGHLKGTAGKFACKCMHLHLAASFLYRNPKSLQSPNMMMDQRYTQDPIAKIIFYSCLSVCIDIKLNLKLGLLREVYESRHSYH